jgi:hypothetical protein
LAVKNITVNKSNSPRLFPKETQHTNTTADELTANYPHQIEWFSATITALSWINHYVTVNEQQLAIKKCPSAKFLSTQAQTEQTRQTNPTTANNPKNKA